MRGKERSMTKEEVYREYAAWTNGRPELTQEDMFCAPAANRDVYENASIVVNHLYFLFVQCMGKRSRYFLFYEENTFEKDENGDLELVYSTYVIPKNGDDAKNNSE